MRAMINDKYPEQQLRIAINAQTPHKFILSKDNMNTIALDIPNSLKNSEWLTLNFYFDNPIQPKTVAPSNDDRYLSIGLISASFE